MKSVDAKNLETRNFTTYRVREFGQQRLACATPGHGAAGLRTPAVGAVAVAA